MSKRYWMHCAAAGGLLAVLIATTVSAQQPSPQNEQRPGNADAGGQLVAVPDNTTLRLIFEEVMKLYAREKRENTASDKRKESRDDATLKAQQEAADWAFFAMVIAGGALLLSLLTIVLVKRT